MSIEPSDPILEVKEAGLTRLRNPFYFSLLVSFAVINWQAFYVLLWPGGNDDALDRLNWIDANLYHEWYWTKVLFGPILIACGYVTVIPKALNWLERIRRRDEVKQANALKNIDGGLQETAAVIIDLKRANAELSASSTKFSTDLAGLQGTHQQAVLELTQRRVALETEQRNHLRHISMAMSRYPEDVEMLHKIKNSAASPYRLLEGQRFVASRLAEIGLISYTTQSHVVVTELGSNVLLSLEGPN